MKTAIIDIGSNSVRLMLWADGCCLRKNVTTTRLGEGIGCGRLQALPMARTVEAVAALCDSARKEGARVYAFATAAVRCAANREDFLHAVRERCGLDVEVISGEEEAAIGLAGALGDRDGGIVDIGGASTEITFRSGGKIVYSHSFPVGCVRLYESCGEDRRRLDDMIGTIVPRLPPLRGGTFYAVGGTASTLACLKLGLTAYDPAALQDLVLRRDWIDGTAERLLSLTAEERKKLPGMDVKRADIIAGGALLLSHILHCLSREEIKFSDRDNLEGYLFTRGLQ